MRRKYTLVCQSAKQRQSLHIALAMEGFNETLNQDYNYIITEFCNLRPIQSDNMILFDTNTMKEILDSIRFFIHLGIPQSKRIYYKNNYVDRNESLSQKIKIQMHNELLAQLEKEKEETIDSPTREYIEEDFEAAEECKEWLKIGILHRAYLQSSDN
jgi:hypothetical protein